MAGKKRRILKKEWESFCNSFTADHILRRASAYIGDDVIIGNPGLPFLALSYDKEGEEVNILFGDNPPDQMQRLVASIKRPRAIYLIEEAEALNSVRGVQIQQAPGKGMVRIIFDNQPPEMVRGQWTADVAYSIYLARGCCHGEDQADWFQAERLIAAAVEKALSMPS